MSLADPVRSSSRPPIMPNFETASDLAEAEEDKAKNAVPEQVEGAPPNQEEGTKIEEQIPAEKAEAQDQVES